MKYTAWLVDERGASKPTPLYAGTIVDAQRKAAAILKGMQADGMMEGWTLSTVTVAE